MKALWLQEERLRVRDDVPIPEPSPGEARVRVTRAGICNTDLEMVRGYVPFTGVLGHEFVGIVDRGPGDLVGRRVVGEINVGCGGCRRCRDEGGRHCPERTVLGIVDRHGAFAQYLVLPGRNLHPVPDCLDDEEAVFVEPLAAALEIQEQVRVRPADRVLVVGDGKLGQLVAQSLQLTGCDLTVVGRHRDKLDLLARRGIRCLTEGEFQDDALAPGFDLAVECAGDPSGFEVARRALRPRRTLVLKSTYAGDSTVDLSSLVVDELTVVGSRCGPFDAALRLLAEERVEVRPLIEARYPLDQATTAIDHARRDGALKVLLTMDR